MKTNAGSLTQEQSKKLTALRRYVGDELDDEVVAKCFAQQAAPAPKADPVAVKIEEAPAGFAKDGSFNPDAYGYSSGTVRRVA